MFVVCEMCLPYTYERFEAISINFEVNNKYERSKNSIFTLLLWKIKVYLFREDTHEIVLRDSSSLSGFSSIEKQLGIRVPLPINPRFLRGPWSSTSADSPDEICFLPILLSVTLATEFRTWQPIPFEKKSDWVKQGYSQL